MKVGTTLHCSVDVEGALLAPYADQRRVCSTLSVDGVRCRSVQEYRAALARLLGQGIKRLPVGNPCEGFSYQTGCPGHRIGEDSGDAMAVQPLSPAPDAGHGGER